VKRFIKISLIFLASFLVLIIISLIAFRIYFNDDKLKELIVDALEENTRGEVDIDSLNISGFVKINLKDLSIKNAADDSVWMRVSNVYIAVKPLALLGGNLRISEIVIDDFKVDYAKIPAFEASASREGGRAEAFVMPVNLIVDDFKLNGFSIYGPDAEIDLDLFLANLRYYDNNDFSATFSLNTRKGLLHYNSDSLSVAGLCDISATGTISSREQTSQNFKATLSDLKIQAGESLIVENLTAVLNTNSKIAENSVEVENLKFVYNENEIIAFTGQIELGENPEISLRAENEIWDLSGVNPILKDIEFPARITGNLSIEDFSIQGSPSYFSYNLTLDLDDIGFDYDEILFLRGLTGQVYSSGDPDAFVFGSSLVADSVSGSDGSEQLFGVYNLSSAVESEISSSDIYFNVTAGIADFFGGKCDLSAFTESSRLDGELKVENVNLSRAASGFLTGEDIDFSGLVNMALRVSGKLDSIQSDLSASLADLKIRMEGDSLLIPQQDFNLSASTVIGKESVNSSFSYGVQDNMSGTGELFYPLEKAVRDSIIMTYRMNLDNSALPSYLPSAILDALGSVELSGGSVVDGRFTSPVDTFMFTGSSKLVIEPTDILISDFQSVLYSLISVSELEVKPGRISLFSNSGIEDLFNENYSDLEFSGITIEGEIVSLTDTTWRITNMNIMIPSLASRFSLLGDFGYSAGVPFSNLTLYYTFESEEPLEIGNQLYVRGKLEAEVNTGNVDTLLQFSGTANFSDVEFESRGVFKCSEISGDIPFSGKINLQDSMFLAPDFKKEVSGSGYQRARSANMLAGEYGRLKIGRIEAAPFYLFDINIDAGFRSGVFDIPYLTGELLGGNFYGVLRGDLSDVNLMREIPNYNALGYKLDLEMSSLDFNQLTYGMGPFKQRADFSADAHFAGNGIIAPEEDYSISGSFHITKMGPGVANRVLDVLDPDNSNPGIVQTKELLNRKLLGLIDMSYKPKNFSFELKHGSLYPRLFMDQPFFAEVVPLVRVPMPVEYGRIPLKSLLDNLKEESW
jgi:hypothetical protein